MCLPANLPAADRAGQFVGPVAVVAPLVGVGIPVRGAGHLPRWTHPVGGHRHGLKSGERTHLLLADVMGPSAAVATHRAGQHQQRQHRAVDGVAVEPLTDAAAHDDHRPATGFLCAAGEFPGDADRLCGRHAGDRPPAMPGCSGGSGRRSRWAIRRATPAAPPRTGRASSRIPCTPGAYRRGVPGHRAPRSCLRR